MSRALWPLLSLAGLIGVWALASVWAASPVLPGPLDVLAAARREIAAGYFFYQRA